jgi:hypothetical protein
MKDRVNTEERKEEWLQLMHQLDRRSREKEILNLPESQLSRFRQDGVEHFGKKELTARADSCSDALFHHDISRDDMDKALYPLLKEPGEYSSFKRAIGLFPLLSLPVDIVSGRVKNRFKSSYGKKIGELPVKGKLRFYIPPGGTDLSEIGIAEMIKGASNNPLSVPLLKAEQEGKLVNYFAPVFIQDVAGLYDRIGRVYWDGNKPEVDLLEPTVYYYSSYAFLHEQPVLQINYVVWYSDRAGDQSPRIERGHLDGLTLRVSVDPKGKPFMVDMMNNCGCYHFFSPSREAVLSIKPRSRGLEPFVPQWLPEVPSGKHLGIRVNSGWHQVERLMAVDMTENTIEYELVPYSSLESFADRNGDRRSIFNAEGIAVGTARIEPLIFFSMGIPSIGSMRQRGHHAIELTGHAHFDDPLVFEENFIFK